MRGMGRGMWGSTLEERPRASMLQRILEGSAGQNNWEVRGIQECAEGKGSTGMWIETLAKKKIVGGEIEGNQKLRKDEGLLATHRQ